MTSVAGQLVSSTVTIPKMVALQLANPQPASDNKCIADLCSLVLCSCPA